MTDTIQTQRSPFDYLALLALCVATPLLIPLEQFMAGFAVLALGLACLPKVASSRRVRLGLLFGVVGLLALAPIHTDRSNAHFLQLGAFFAAVVLIPSMVMRARGEPIDWRFWPRRFSWLDIFYVALTVPLAWGVIRGYFFEISPFVPENWPMPQPYTEEGKWRLFVGINCVGIWDELFFINTVYALMRACFPKDVANLAQAVVYTAVLNDMAFTGIGPLVIYIFALTQGAMYERSRCLLYVLIVHLLVDAFLVAAILQYHYPDTTFAIF